MDWLEAFKAFVLGAIQGLTEFLPVSSTGHLYLGRKLFHLEEAGLFLDTMLHIGTLIAVMIIYWRDLLFILRKPFSKLTLLLVIGTIPTLIIAYLLKDIVDQLEKSGASIGWEFLITGMALWLADSIKNRGDKTLEQITYTDAAIIGLFQGVAVMPAISRSGMTIAAALFRKINKDAAAHFSFLLSIPALLAAIGYQSLSLLKGGNPSGSISLPALLIGIVTSGILGYIAVKWMIALVKRGSLKWFAVYVWVLGILIIAAQWMHWF
jgi:undecaprenyl-diphosphatase